MIFKEFNLFDKNGKSNCVVRSLCKILNKEYDEVYDDLVELTKKLNSSSFNAIPVFEKYMEDNNIVKIDFNYDVMVKDLKLDNESYIAFCYDKKDYYHMLTIINNVIYDKNINCMNLYVISIYKKI